MTIDEKLIAVYQNSNLIKNKFPIKREKADFLERLLSKDKEKKEKFIMILMEFEDEMTKLANTAIKDIDKAKKKLVKIRSESREIYEKSKSDVNSDSSFNDLVN